jgi:glycosyltransferase involved in cell wall biosynthesis
MSAGRALVATYVVPEPDRDSGSKRIIDHVDLLRDLGYEVTFVTTQPMQDDRHLRSLRARGVGVYEGTPSQLERLLTAAHFDVALLAFWPTAELFLPTIRRLSPATRVIVDSVDLHFLRHARRIYGAVDGEGVLDDRFGDQVTSELNVYAAADAVLTVSAKEAELIDDLVNEAGLSRVVADNEQLELSPRGFDERHGLVFVGSFRHAPNVDAVAYLCREITPKLPPALLAEHPVAVVGDALDDRVAAHGEGQPAVHMVGWVPTLEPYFEQARVCILPLLSGAGTKRKMIQALMLGTPVVGTSIAAEGLDLQDGRDVLIADDAAGFVAAVERLSTDRELWERLRLHGRERALERHGRGASRSALAATIAAVEAAPPKGPVLAPTDGERHHQRLLYQWQMSQLESGAREARTSALARDRAAAVDDAPAPATSAIGAAAPSDGDEADVRLIAFYLPQFHPIPENDEWWGEGFTEWTNVRAATPLFDGHDQPKAPGELGYYDLRDPGVRACQAVLAREHGVDAFAYYHYWFGGKRLLERPFSEVLTSGEPDLPFVLCWANESWSRRWDGSEHHILQQQVYSREDDRTHLRALLPALTDPRAVQVEGKPLFIVYQGHVLPEPATTTDIWREEAARAGLPGLHLLSVETGYDEGWDNTEFGFDGKIRFQPQFNVLQRAPRRWIDEHAGLHVYDYGDAVPVLDRLPPVGYPTYETVFPAWDNTARRGPDGWVLHGSTPAAYEAWLRGAVERARQRPPAERIVFINAWNEWAEGAYLEPDERHGRAYLEATRAARGRVADPV